MFIVTGLTAVLNCSNLPVKLKRKSLDGLNNLETHINSLIDDLVTKLKSISGVKAIVLGGSRADDTHRPDSDFDIGIYYDDPQGFDLAGIKNIANQINDTPNPVVTALGEWGKWVNGGAWLTVKGQKIDFLYRDLNFVNHIIRDCKKGLRQSDFYPQPPYGFHSYIYCAEIQVCQILFDPENLILRLKSEVREYPPALKRTIINDFLWDAEFSLLHARKAANRGEILILAGCLTKIASDFLQVLYALNEVFFISEKKFTQQEKAFRVKPNNFLERINDILATIGKTAKEMNATILETEKLFAEIREIAKGIYNPGFKH